MVQILSKSLLLLGKFGMLVWLAIFASQAGFSERKASCELSIYGSLKIDVCGNERDKQFILVMSIGEVKRSDSLYGFNYEIYFDNKKVKLTDALYLNTLSEFMEVKSTNINNSLGKITGYALTFGLEPIYGKRPLIAFSGLWISECPDTSRFEINFIEFTDEFKVRIDSLIPAILIGTIDSTEDRVIRFTIIPDSVVIFDNRFEFNGSIKIPLNSRLEYFDIETSYQKDIIKVDSVEVLDSNIEYLINDNNESGTTFKFKLNSDDGRVCNLRFYGTVESNNEFSTEIILSPKFERDCKCVISSTNDSLIVMKRITNIVNQENNQFEIDDNCKFLVYDVMGNLYFNSDKLPDNFDFLAQGMYFVVEFCGEKKNIMKLINVY